MESAENPFLAEALNRMWKQFLPQMNEPGGGLDAANEALGAGKLSEDQRA